MSHALPCMRNRALYLSPPLHYIQPGPQLNEPGVTWHYECCRHGPPRRRGEGRPAEGGRSRRLPRKLEKLGFCPAWLQATTDSELKVKITVLNMHSHPLDALRLRLPKRVRDRMIFLIRQGLETDRIISELHQFGGKAAYLTKADVAMQSTPGGRGGCK